MLADSKAEVYAARCMVIDCRATARRRRERQHRGVVLPSFSPPRCAAGSPTARCRSTAARATSSEYAIERFYRDVRLFRIYEGTSQIQQLVIARNMIRSGVV